MLVAKCLCRSVGDLPARCVSSPSGSHDGVLKVHPSGSKKFVSHRLLNRDCRKDEREQPNPLLQLSL
jgi:hypothetical protein